MEIFGFDLTVEGDDSIALLDLTHKILLEPLHSGPVVVVISFLQFFHPGP